MDCLAYCRLECANWVVPGRPFCQDCLDAIRHDEYKAAFAMATAAGKAEFEWHGEMVCTACAERYQLPAARVSGRPAIHRCGLVGSSRGSE